MSDGPVARERRVGVLGGTFDPPHIAHLFVAEEVRTALSLDEVLFVPAQRSPLKRVASAPARDRLAMIWLAIGDNDHFSVSTADLERPAPSYTVDTLERLAVSLAATAELYLIMGADQLRDLRRWRKPDRLAQLAHVVVVNRPGHARGTSERVRRLIPEVAGRVQYLEIPPLAIASRDIRRRVAADGSIRYLVPESVRQYIERHGLYRHQCL